MEIIITFEGKDWHFDKDAIGVDEWRELKRKYGMTPRKFDEGLNQGDPDTYTFVYWVMLRQNGDMRQSLGDHLKPDIIALNHAVGEAEHVAPPEPEEPADPPIPAVSGRGTTRSAGSGKATSTRSAASTSSSSPATADSPPLTSGG